MPGIDNPPKKTKPKKSGGVFFIDEDKEFQPTVPVFEFNYQNQGLCFSSPDDGTYLMEDDTYITVEDGVIVENPGI